MAIAAPHTAATLALLELSRHTHKTQCWWSHLETRWICSTTVTRPRRARAVRVLEVRKIGQSIVTDQTENIARRFTVRGLRRPLSASRPTGCSRRRVQTGDAVQSVLTFGTPELHRHLHRQRRLQLGRRDREPVARVTTMEVAKTAAAIESFVNEL